MLYKALGLERKRLAIQHPPSQDILETSWHSEGGRTSAPCLPSGRGPPASLEAQKHACEVLTGVPQIRKWKSQPPRPFGCDLIWKWGCCNRSGWAPHPVIGVLINTENMEMDVDPGRRPRDGGRGQGDVSTSQGPPKTASKPPGSRKEVGHIASPSQPIPADTLTLDCSRL